MDEKLFHEILADNILEYIFWRETHGLDYKVLITFDSPFFFFRNKYPEGALFPLKNSFDERFSSLQNNLIRDIWTFLEVDYFSIISYNGFSHPLINFLITERPFRSGKHKLSLIDPEWISDEEAEQLDNFLEKYPSNLFLHQAKCLYLYAKRDYKNVEREIDKILQLDTDNIMYLCRYSRLLAEALINVNEPREIRCRLAEKSLQRAIELLGADAERVTFIYAWLGLVYSKNQQYSRAMPYITKTIDLNIFFGIDFFEPYFWKAKILFYLGNITEVHRVITDISQKWSLESMKIEMPHKKKLFEKYEYFLLELEQTNYTGDFESHYSEILVEEMLYRRDDTKKTWGHIYGKTVVYSYRRFRKKTHWMESPYEGFEIDGLQSLQKIFYKEGNFSDRQVSFIRKYHLYNFTEFLSKEIQDEDIYIFPLIVMIHRWYNSHYLRASLDLNKHDKYPILLFLYALSVEQDYIHNYYFPFSEYIDREGEKYLLMFHKLQPKHLFANIALASYYIHAEKYHHAQKFAHQALSIDQANPWVLGKLALLYQAMGHPQMAIGIMKKLLNILPNDQWVRDWYGKILLDNSLFGDVIIQINAYDLITDGRYRTFEPYLWRAIALFHLGRFSEIPAELEKEKSLYFGEGYRYRLDELKKIFSKL